MSTQMRDGSVVEDPRLGRLIQFDERSRRYSVGAVLPSPALKTRSWPCSIWLDQSGSQCTGMSRTYDLAARPSSIRYPDGAPLDEAFAEHVYQRARTLDEWVGEDYEGSSVLGALKAAVQLGFVGEYRWAFSIDDMCAALSNMGPVVAGTRWLRSMFEPRPSGLLEVDPSSGEDGGHAYMLRRILVSDRAKRDFLGRGEPRRPVPLLVTRNSWSRGWGKDGEAGIWADDYERHLMPDGEQSIVTKALRRA